MCLLCFERPCRRLPDPIPDEGYEVSWAEGMIGRALYCVECFAALDEGAVTG